MVVLSFNTLGGFYISQLRGVTEGLPTAYGEVFIYGSYGVIITPLCFFHLYSDGSFPSC